MRRHLRIRSLAAVLVAGTIGFCWLSSARAEVRTITASGEYRMGDNDTRTDAKRLALLDAKRLALEQVGTYLEGVSEVKNLQVTKDEIRTYTAGIVEVTEQATRDVMEGVTHIVRVDVTCKIDRAVLARQIEDLRKNEHAKEELQQARAEADKLKQEVDAKNKELAALKSKTGAEPLLKEREQALAKLDAQDLVVRASRPVTARGGFVEGDPLPAQDRANMKAMLLQAVALDPSNVRAHMGLGHLLQEEGDPNGAVREFREALRYKPDLPRAHAGLGRALIASGRKDDGIRELRLFLQTVQPTPANQRTIERVQRRLRELERQDDRRPPPRRPPPRPRRDLDR
jgi:tetratricopeptide (TPR) repeat protein